MRDAGIGVLRAELETGWGYQSGVLENLMVKVPELPQRLSPKADNEVLSRVLHGNSN